MTQWQEPAAPLFLLSGSSHSLRAFGRATTFPDPFDAATALRNGEVPLIVGAFPFDTGMRAALVTPQQVHANDGPLEPAARYRGQEATAQLMIGDVAAATTLAEHQAALAAAVATIQRTALQQVCLARAVDVFYTQSVDPLLLAARFVEHSAGRCGYAVDLSATGRFEDRGTSLVGAGSDVLVEVRDGEVRAFLTVATAPRTGEPAVDEASACCFELDRDNHPEHLEVLEQYRRVLEPLCTNLVIPELPSVHVHSDALHLATAISGQLRDGEYSALDLALMLHPSPAVAGVPPEAALGVIGAAEEQPREFFGGAVGWCDEEGNGLWRPATRCAILDEDHARLWAGASVSAQSDPLDKSMQTANDLHAALRLMNVPEGLCDGCLYG